MLPENHRLHPNQRYIENQFVDNDLGICYPWWTKPFINELLTWDLSNKTIFEYGCGASTLWLAHKCKKIVSVEDNETWFNDVKEGLGHFPELEGKYELKLRSRGTNSDLNGGGENTEYVLAPFESTDVIFDTIIVDGNCRNECIRQAVKYLADNGGLLIIDNWNQPSCGSDNHENDDLLSQFPFRRYFEPTHSFGDWNTVYFICNKRNV